MVRATSRRATSLTIWLSTLSPAQNTRPKSREALSPKIPHSPETQMPSAHILRIMKTSSLAFLVTGAATGIAAYLVLSRRPPQYATGYDSVEDAAETAASWGAKQRLTGSGTSVLGKVKEGIGRLAGDPQLTDEGTGDQAVGAVKDAAGKVAGAVGQTIHDLNR
jgi:uncharacterized protein YjbJ (UPF0337 family)